MKLIIPIASGKGGVGKSVITANLGFSLAKLGHQVIVADLDFGGANLHNYLGLKNNNPGLGEFLQDRSDSLTNLLVPTFHPNLKFLPGEGATPFMADLNVMARRRLLVELHQLPAEIILLDLSAGCNALTLDFFNASQTGLLITRPESPSVLNLLEFLRQTIYRRLLHYLSKDRDLLNQVRNFLFQPINSVPVVTMRDILQLISAHHPNIAKTLQEDWDARQVRVVFNQVEQQEDLGFWLQVQALARDQLSCSLESWAQCPTDPSVSAALKAQTPLVQQGVSTQLLCSLQQLAKRIQNNWFGSTSKIGISTDHQDH
ncbi:MAG: P-loop NTPase [bacterium]